MVMLITGQMVNEMSDSELLERELLMVHRLLECMETETTVDRTVFLHEYSTLRARQEETLFNLRQEKADLIEVS